MQKTYSALILTLCFIPSLIAADPPPGVDAALRERVQTFYQLHVDRKFRQAEEFVAADSKDYYYESKKPELKDFRITRIDYGPDFQRAKVSLSSKTQVMLPGAGPVSLDLPFYTNWKIEDGKWCWYIDQSASIETPFGKIKNGAAGDPSKLFDRASPETVTHAVQSDRERIQLDSRHPKPEIVTFTNTLPGAVSLRLGPESPALKIQIGKTELAANESTTLTIAPVEGASERPDSVLVNVQPMSQVISIGIDWAK